MVVKVVAPGAVEKEVEARVVARAVAEMEARTEVKEVEVRAVEMGVGV